MKGNRELRKNLKKFNRNARRTRKAILDNASKMNMSLKEYVTLCSNSWVTVILYSNFPGYLLYTYGQLLKKYKLCEEFHLW